MNALNCYRARLSVFRNWPGKGSAVNQNVKKPLVRGALLGPTAATLRFAGWANPARRSSFARREIADYSSAVRAPVSHRFLRAARDRPCQKWETRLALRR